MTSAPRATQRPHELTFHGDTRVDPYYWLMNRTDPEVLAHLEAENAYTEAALGDLSALTNEIFEEIKSHVAETDMSLPVRHGSWWYFERVTEGQDYPQHCRVPVGTDTITPPAIDPSHSLPGEVVLYDENIEAAGHDFFATGILSLSPDDRWMAVGFDTEGHERFSLTFRPIGHTATHPEVITDVYYSFAWSMDARHVFYTRVDDAMRPWRLYRHELGSDPASDVLVYQEDDPKFFVSVGRSRDDQVILVQCGSSTTTEFLFVPADDPTAPLQSVAPRRAGVEYDVEHVIAPNGTTWWVCTTNDDAVDFRVLARPTRSDEWRQIMAERTGQRVDGVDAFATHLVLSERLDGCAVVRVVPLLDGPDPFGPSDLAERATLVRGDDDPSTTIIAENLEHDLTHVRIVMTSLVTPRTTYDVELATGALVWRKTQIVRGDFDPTRYVTGRLWVPASDGTRIPVSVVARKDVVAVADDGQLLVVDPAPLLLYGYGSYEISMDPAFSALRLSLLDRGIIFALAHVRGGGEMGRSWYLQGKMALKPTTFSDYVAVARYLVAQGWTSPGQLAASGGSAGGLLMGAVMNLAPELFQAVLAAVPFVDALTTMLDPSLPLTMNEWEEWGNPLADADAYRTMKGYSPYDNVRSTNDDGTPRVYPHLLAVGGLNDSRVGFWEPAKWVQRLRDANPANVAYLKTDLTSGHGGPSGRYDAWRDDAKEYAFIVSEITRR